MPKTPPQHNSGVVPERMDDPHRAAWYALCVSLDSKQTCTLLERLARERTAARADERQRIVERLLHAANVVNSDEVSRTALTLEKMAAILVAEGPE